MKLLILGNSNIVRRRVLPALSKSGIFSEIEIASRRPLEGAGLPQGVAKFHHRYEEALEKSGAELVYVSMINSAHEEWARKALEAGRHVVVDKPAFMSYRVSQELAELAKTKGKLLAEATVYAYHPQIRQIKKLFAEADTEPTRILAAFSVPPFSRDNFRNDKSLGGGALLDLGPYAASVGRLFFEKEPQSVSAKILSQHGPQGIDLAFSLLMTYAGGRSLVGQFGFDTEYRNGLNIFGPKLSVSVERVFTIAPDMNNTLNIRHQNREQVVTVPPADSFSVFFSSVVDAIGLNQVNHFADTLCLDARVLETMRKAAAP